MMDDVKRPAQVVSLVFSVEKNEVCVPSPHAAIRYTVSMPNPHAHLFHVTLEADGCRGEALDLALPVWTPGSYMVRDYARHIQLRPKTLTERR